MGKHCLMCNNTVTDTIFCSMKCMDSRIAQYSGVSDDDIEVCEVCEQPLEDGCDEDCECESCMVERGERYMDGLMDTYD